MTREQARAAGASDAQLATSPLPRGRRAHPASYRVLCTDNGEVRVELSGAAATASTHTFVDDLPLASTFGDVVPAACADLVDIAVATYAADRVCRRHPRSAPRSEALWQRRMYVEIPVREPERWADARVCGPLTELLSYITDDLWRLAFVPRHPDAARLGETQTGLFRPPPLSPASAALFSGGLDSLAGLVTRLVSHPAETVVVFSGRTNKRIGAPQRTLLQALSTEFPNRVRPVAVRFGLDGRAKGDFDHEETSQRTRGFVFQAFGAVMARMAGLDRLDIYENGVGAINLPYTGGQLGSQATRATHPVTLQLMSALLTAVFGAPFTVALPYALITKGELCVALRNAGLGSLARESVSCDGYPQRRKRAAQCGVCPSCVLRRQSLHHARLIDDDPTSLYLHDVYDAGATDAWQRRFSFRAMSGQVHHLRRALASQQPWEALTHRYPELAETADALALSVGVPDVRDALVDLYHRYCTEWGAFTADAAGQPSTVQNGMTVDVRLAARSAAPTRNVIARGRASAVKVRGTSEMPDLWQIASAEGHDEH